MNLKDLEFKAEDFGVEDYFESFPPEQISDIVAQRANYLLRERLEKATNIDELVNRFLAWPLPETVCSDTCVTERNYPFPRVGTNLLTADEARLMLQHVLARLVCAEEISG